MRLEDSIEIRIEKLEDIISKEGADCPMETYKSLMINYELLIKITDDIETEIETITKMKQIEFIF